MAYDFVSDKDPNHVYRWCNTHERAMNLRRYQGWETAFTKDAVPPEIAAQGQSTAAPAGGTTITRGDLILMRMPKELHEERIVRPIRERRERQNITLDTMVQQANEEAQRALRAAGYDKAQIRDAHVFQSTADRKFDSKK
jgi:hypothetical protein